MNPPVESAQQSQTIQDENTDLENRLREARAKANLAHPQEPIPTPFSEDTAQHFLLLLSDSALPLGSFAFSSGLESYLAHNRSSSKTCTIPSFTTFLTLSLSSHASAILPFVLAAHRDPSLLQTLDDALDASIICTVGRRASIAQGRALLSIWERSFVSSIPSTTSPAALSSLKAFSTLLRSPSKEVQTDFPQASAHLGPLFGVISKALGIDLYQTAYVFMLGHIKALVSAAVRASMFGPYQAQKVLVGTEVQEGIREVIEREWGTWREDAGQSVPVMDLWVGRHELLYSRIFNS